MSNADKDKDPDQKKAPSSSVSQAVIDAAFALSKLDGENGSNDGSDGDGAPEKDAANDKDEAAERHNKTEKHDTKDPLKSNDNQTGAQNEEADNDEQLPTSPTEDADASSKPETFNAVFRVNNKRTFPEKLMKLMGSEDAQDVVVWLPEGKSFTIIKPDAFVNDILPKYFKQAQLSSFVRRLHRWGFRQLKKETGESTYEHDLFLRDDPDLCLQMCCTSYSLSQKRRTKIKQEATREYTRQMELAAEAAKRYHVSHLPGGMHLPPPHGPPHGYPGVPLPHYPPPHHYGHPPHPGMYPPPPPYGRPPAPSGPTAPAQRPPAPGYHGDTSPTASRERYDGHVSPAASNRPSAPSASGSHGPPQRRQSSGGPGPNPSPYTYPGIGEHGPYGPPHHMPPGHHPPYYPPPGGEHHHPYPPRGPPPANYEYGAPGPAPSGGHYDPARTPAGAQPSTGPDYGMHAPPVPPHRYEYM